MFSPLLTACREKQTLGLKSPAEMLYALFNLLHIWEANRSLLEDRIREQVVISRRVFLTAVCTLMQSGSCCHVSRGSSRLFISRMNAVEFFKYGAFNLIGYL